MRRDSAITPACIIYRCEATLWPRSAAVAALGRRVVVQVCVCVCVFDSMHVYLLHPPVVLVTWKNGGDRWPREIVDFSRDDYMGGW